MKRTLYSLGLGLTLLVLSGSAGAAPFTPYIDFRDPMFDPPHGVRSHTFDVHGYSLTLEALEATTLSSDGKLFWDEDDGFGIRDLAYEKDEIEDPEVLRISFSHMPYVERFLITDLYMEHGYAETGSFSIDGGSSWTPFAATGRHRNGMVEVPIHAMTDAVLFTAPGRVGNESHEYSVAGVDARWGRNMERAVPEPGAALLFTAGFFLLGRYQRGRRA